jgi:hypothetical protein
MLQLHAAWSLSAVQNMPPGFERQADANFHGCHDGTKSMDGENSQPNACDPQDNKIDTWLDPTISEPQKLSELLIPPTDLRRSRLPPWRVDLIELRQIAAARRLLSSEMISDGSCCMSGDNLSAQRISTHVLISRTFRGKLVQANPLKAAIS